MLLKKGMVVCVALISLAVYHLYLSVRLLYFYVFADDYLRAEVESEPHDEPQAHLPDDFELAVQPFFVFLEYLDVIVCKAQRAQPYCCDKHQHHIDIVQSA